MNRFIQTPPVVKNLIIINILVFMATSMLPVGDRLLSFATLSLGTPWFHTYQFVTYMFLHANLEHLFFNMFALWMFGRTLEYELGSRRFLVYYFVCGVGAALVQYLVALGFGELPLFLVGASRVYLIAFEISCSITNESHFSSVTILAEVGSYTIPSRRRMNCVLYFLTDDLTISSSAHSRKT